MLAHIAALADGPPLVAWYAPALVGVLGFACARWRKRPEAAIGGAILFANWVACFLLGYFCHSGLDPVALAAIDWTSGIAFFPLMWSSRGAIGIVAVYALQLVTHAARVLATIFGYAPAYADNAYFWTLSYTAWAQLALLALWTFYGGRLSGRNLGWIVSPHTPRTRRAGKGASL